MSMGNTIRLAWHYASHAANRLGSRFFDHLRPHYVAGPSVIKPKPISKGTFGQQPWLIWLLSQIGSPLPTDYTCNPQKYQMLFRWFLHGGRSEDNMADTERQLVGAS
jgi:hypothetical protein